MELNRADMKLLVETGYSSIMRHTGAEIGPIFAALDVWLPDNTAGPVGQALELAVQGSFDEADDLLTKAIAERPTGKGEAKAILALVKAMRRDMPAVEKIAAELEGQDTSAARMTKLIVDEDPDLTDAAGSQEPAHAATG